MVSVSQGNRTFLAGQILVPRFSLLPAARILLAVWEADTSRIGRHFLRPFLHTVSSKRLGAARKSHPSGPLPWHVKPMA
jgi:hypothetical protein